tara:strand:+ start:5431 stop:5922 length:492 start_codon:yes stop_codon:yes gene_type:complete
MTIHDNKKDVNDKLSEAMGVEFEKEETKEIKKKEISAPSVQNKDMMKDYNLVRHNIKGLIETGEVAIEGILKVATEGDSPRAYEVAAQMIKTVAEANKDLIDLHKKMKEIKREDITLNQNNTTNNSIYVGSTTDLQDLINQSRSAKKSLTENIIIDTEIVDEQ